MFFKFCDDKVARVSEPAATALAPILLKFSDERDQQKAIIKIVQNNFRYGRKATYKRRQLYLIMCEEVVNQAKDLFDEFFKQGMLSLVADRVVNVRLILARVLKNHFRKINCTLMNDPLVNQAIRVLRQDKSRDVQYYMEELQTYHDVSDDTESNSSRSTQDDGAAQMANFLEALQLSSRRTLVDLDETISLMEDEIINKSGVDITRNSVADEANDEPKFDTTPKGAALEKADEDEIQQKEEPVQKRPEDMQTPPGAMLIGKEEDVNLLSDDIEMVDDQNNFGHLDRRSDVEEPQPQDNEEPAKEEV